MASAMAPSVPGWIGIHSSAFCAVSVKAGSMTTSLQPRFFALASPLLSKRPWFAPNMFIPQSMTYLEFSKSCMGKMSPKSVRAARRRSPSQPMAWPIEMLGVP